MKMEFNVLKNKKIVGKTIVLSAIASILLGGCDSGSSSNSSSEDATITSSTNLQTGQLIDSPVEGADYDCLADGEYNKVTTTNGEFQCKDMSEVQFRIGKLKIGEIHGLPADNKVFVPDLIGVDRNDSLQNEDVIALAKLLQSIDEDKNATNGIQVPEYVKHNIAEEETEFHKDELNKHLEKVSISPEHIPSTYETKEHLRESFRVHKAEGYDHANEQGYENGNREEHANEQGYENGNREEHANEQGYENGNREDHANEQGYENGNREDHANEQGYENGNREDHANEQDYENGNREEHANEQGYENGNREDHANGDREHNQTNDNCNFNLNQYPVTENLSQPLKDAIAYMGNEERLAYDVYMNLYKKYEDSSDATALYPLYDIADKSETQHISIVRALVKRYSLTPDQLTNVTKGVADSNDPLGDLPTGEFDIEKIQTLYDSLFNKGIQSSKDALEVGCIVEVTDVNDLDEYIELAEADEATDIVEAFNVLRTGSYHHYWAFDQALKNMGVEDGCCSLGGDFCKTEDEYPKDGMKEQNN